MGLATLPCKRCETYETGRVGVVEAPELGRLDHEHICGRLASRAQPDGGHPQCEATATVEFLS
jgi:hypothetical protein